MQILETLRVALEALRSNKLRAFLTMLGIVIGVAAVIAMVALGTGAQASVKERIASLGTTLISVSPRHAHGPGRVASDTDEAELTMADMIAIRDQATTIVAVQPEMARRMQVQFENKNTSTNIIGATANYLEVAKFKVEYGRMFTDGDDAARKRYAVMGPQVLADLELTNPASAIGQFVRIGSVQFEVIGVMAAKGQGSSWFNPDDQVVIPIQTAQYRVMGTDQLRSINALASSEENVSLAMAEVQRVLRRQHKLKTGEDDDFRIRNQADFLNTLGETTEVFTLLLAGIAAVSLVVGGIGIMNIMLVSVTERTREIGIRMAVGATRTNILLQFLIEALVLCLAGGIVGVALGAGTAIALRVAFNWNTAVGPSSILLAFAFSAAVGILFGVWPARRAARLDPIESLRYE